MNIEALFGYVLSILVLVLVVVERTSEAIPIALIAIAFAKMSDR